MYSREFSFRCAAYPEKDKFVGVCLDLNIVEEHDTLAETVDGINDAILSHLLAAAELGFPQELIYRPAPKECWDKAKEIASREVKMEAKQPLPLFTLYNQKIQIPQRYHAS
jgi:hypothetical protein